MKNTAKYLLLILVLCACQKETDSVQSETENTILVESIEMVNHQKRSYGPRIHLKVQYGRRSCQRQYTNCRCINIDLDKFCGWEIDFLQVPPLEFEEPQTVGDFCHIFSCGWNHSDPWEVYENIDPLEFGSIKDHFKLEIEQPTAEAFITTLNDELLVAQFYTVNQMMNEPSPETNIYYLNDEIVFEESLAKEIGLSGTTISSGKYPIVYNKENQTYNVIFKVQ